MDSRERARKQLAKAWMDLGDFAGLYRRTCLNLFIAAFVTLAFLPRSLPSVSRFALFVAGAGWTIGAVFWLKLKTYERKLR